MITAMIDGQPVRNAVTIKGRRGQAGDRAERMQRVDDMG
jgi:hypothetical protein